MVREMLSDITVARWLQCATNDMLRNNRTDIRCSCRRCKLECVTEPDFGILEKNLKRNGLMDGYTRWISDETGDQEEELNGGAPGNEQGKPDEDQDARHQDQDAGHEDQADAEHEDQVAGHEDQYSGHTDSASWVRNPHVQELLVKEPLNARGAAREKAKLAQLEKDAVTKLYEGCNEGDTRLNVTLESMQLKAKHKWTDESYDDMMAFWHARLPKDNTCPTSIGEAKKALCPLDLPHVKYNVCLNDCIIYRGEDAEKTIS